MRSAPSSGNIRVTVFEKNCILSPMQKLQINIDRLKDGKTIEIEEVIPSELMGIQETELVFDAPIEARGQAYMASDHLIICLNVSTSASMPCKICNEMTPLPIAIERIYISVESSEFKGPEFDYSDTLRENILLEVPPTLECHKGECPERQTVKKYLMEN